MFPVNGARPAGPSDCSVTQRHVSSALLLCDYTVSVYDNVWEQTTLCNSIINMLIWHHSRAIKKMTIIT